MNTIEFDTACARLEAAKIAESRATSVRLDAEANLLRLVQSKDEGSVTAKGAAYKATVTTGYNRTIDAALLDNVRRAVPAALFDQAIEYKPALKLQGLRYLQNNEPDTYAVLAQAITARPAKPSVKVEALVVSDTLDRVA